MAWFDARDLTVEGRPWDDTASFWERLPARAKDAVTPAVRRLGANTAGLAVRFVTDARRVSADWTTSGFNMTHMAATGIRGLDMYIRRAPGAGWEFAAYGKPGPDARTTQTLGFFMPDLPGEPVECLLYLPLYDSVKELLLGVPEGALMARAPARPPERAKPIVFYGTSITQGGCASRAGMCHVALLGRWLDRPVVNWGFSGSGKMEPVMADLLAELDPALYVLECLPNMTHEMVRERVEPFVHRLRQAHPDTPILLVENPIRPETNQGNVELRAAWERLQAARVPHLYYLPGRGQMYGPESGTVDGVHPTDLGFYRMATVYEPVLREILGN
ncbi:MAG: SGNH/GDSL hydrolase family protein [Candidatus Sumerlaeia bacterium]